MRRWTPTEIDRLLCLRDVEKKPWEEIDNILGRARTCSLQKYRAEQIKRGIARPKPRVPRQRAAEFPGMPVRHYGPEGARQADDRALAAREELRKARLVQSPISALLNEPPPGYSALDRKRAAETDAR